MDKDIDAKLYAAALYQITTLYFEKLNTEQRAYLASAIVGEIHLRKIIETKYEKAMLNYRGDGEGGMRLHGLPVGHVLTARDVQDIQDLLDDHNDMCGALPEAHHEGERSAIRRVGGEELLAKWDTLFEREVDEAATKALAYVNAKMAELGKNH